MLAKQHPPVGALQDALGVTLSCEMLTLALTHRSYAYENGGLPTNERLEFLGDAVLGMVVTDTLFHAHPELPEGQLAKLRASVVNMRALAGVARAIGLGHHLLLGRGEEVTGGRDKDSLLADAVEALLGAVYVGVGTAAAADVVHRLFDPLLAAAAALGAGLDWKTSLQELAAARALGIPVYRISETGPDHAKCFTAMVAIGDTIAGEGYGSTKKQAEQHAAEAAWLMLSAPDPGA